MDILRILLTVIFLTAGLVFAQQIADPSFDAKVAHPAYITEHPKVLFDEAHYNFHTVSGRYKPFADLITNDGYEISVNKQKFTNKALAGFDLLVIANALGAARQTAPDASLPAFTVAECDAVRDWVRNGGSLLLIADHAPFGTACERLSLRFEVEMSKGLTADAMNHDPETGNLTFLVFSRRNKLLIDHPITKGRDASELITGVMTFSGQSLKGPEGSVAFLKLSDSAFDRRPPDNDATIITLSSLPDGVPRMTIEARTEGQPVSAAGRAQGVALTFGNGRVVVMGEAAMLSAQVTNGVVPETMAQKEVRLGMNRKGNDNRQLTLNIMHWLSHLLN